MLLLLFGCHVHEDSDCVTQTREVGDDEVLGDIGLTGAELVAEVGGAHTFDVEDRDGATTGATFTVARGEGAIVFHDAEWVPTSEVRPGLFDHDTMMFVLCEDSAELSFDVSAELAEAAVSVAGTADGEARPGPQTVLQGRIGAAGVVTPLDEGDGDGRLLAVFDDGPVDFEITLDDDRSWRLAGVRE